MTKDSIKLFSILFFLLAISVGKASGQDLRGKITDKTTGLPLPGVALILNNSVGTSTDPNGHFLLKMIPGSNFLTIRYLGYQSFQDTIRFQDSLSKDGTSNLVKNYALTADVFNLRTTVVSASRYEQKISEVSVSMAVIKPAFVESNNSINLDDAIDRIPGLNVLKGQVNIRGSSGFSYGTGTRVLLLVDDMPMLSADASDVKWTYIPMENVAQVEVIKGASSALFGSSALGGVINVRTAYPGSKPLTKIRFFTKAYGPPPKEHVKLNPALSFASGLNLFHSQQIGRFDLSTGLNTIFDDTHREGEYFKRIRLNANSRYRFKKEGMYAGLNVNSMIDSSGQFLFWDDEKNVLSPDSGSNSRQIAYRFNVDPYFSFSTKAGGIHKARARYFYNSFTGTTISSKAEMLFSEYFYRHVLSKAKNYKADISLGISNTLNIITSDSLYGNRQSNTAALFGQLEQKIASLKLSVGYRMERFHIEEDEAVNRSLLRGGLNYAFSKASHLRMSYGQGFRNPSVAERYARTSAGSVTILPNPSLEGEKGWSGELGFNQILKMNQFLASLDLALFQTSYEDMIEYVFGIWSGELGFLAKNKTFARIRGFEFTSQFGTNKTRNNWKGSLGYTYIDPQELNEFKEETDDVLKYRQKHLLRADAELILKRLSIGANIRYNSFMIRIDDAFNENIDGVKQYRVDHSQGDLVIDARANYDLSEDFKIGLVIGNIANTSYAPIIANIGAPRNFSLILSWVSN